MEQAVYRRSYGGRAFDGHTSHSFQDLEKDESAREFASRGPMPIFLSDPGLEPDPDEFAPAAQRRHGRVAARLVAGGLALAAVAILVTVYQSDVARGLITQAKASISSLTQQPAPASKPALAQSVSKDAARPAATMQTVSQPANVPAAALPTREAILSAYNSALQGRPDASRTPDASAAVAPSAEPAQAQPGMPVQVHRLDADTLAGLMKRANSLLAIGDITGARLLLERAANAQDAAAATLLAQTYDPAVLGVRDIRSVTPDPEMARQWYQKAASFGSHDAQQRLSQLNN